MNQNNEQGIDYNLGRLEHSFGSGLALWNRKTLNSVLREKVKKLGKSYQMLWRMTI